MSAFERMCDLLAPLNLYNLDDGIMRQELVTWGNALDEADESINYAGRQSNLITVDGDILKYEYLFQVALDESLDLAEKRAILLTRVDGGAVGGIYLLKKILQMYNLEANIEEIASEYKVVIQAPVPRPKWFDAAEEAILLVAPAHIQIEFIFKTMTFGALSAYTHQFLKSYTHQEILQYEMEA